MFFGRFQKMQSKSLSGDSFLYEEYSGIGRISRLGWNLAPPGYPVHSDRAREFAEFRTRLPPGRGVFPGGFEAKEASPSGCQSRVLLHREKAGRESVNL
jgi:hypothetical protein